MSRKGECVLFRRLELWMWSVEVMRWTFVVGEARLMEVANSAPTASNRVKLAIDWTLRLMQALAGYCRAKHHLADCTPS